MSKKKEIPPKVSASSVAPNTVWNTQACLELIDQLWALRKSMLHREAAFGAELGSVSVDYRESARNLVHYLTLRSEDLRPIQDKLSWLGLSSLGQSESHVLANVDKVLGVLHRLTEQIWEDKSAEEPAGSVRSRHLMARHTKRLLGLPPIGRPVHIMVTLPSEAASDFSVVRQLVDAGMDVARINCAHDGAPQWVAMAESVRRAAKSVQRDVRILMDLGGPKIRTGEVAPGPAVLKLRPQRDQYGRVFRPARLGIVPNGSGHELQGVDAAIGVAADWLERIKVGTQVDFSDSRGAKRHFLITKFDEFGAIGESLQTAYLTPETVLSIHGADKKKKSSTLVCQIESFSGYLNLQQGDVLRLTKGGVGHAAAIDDDAGDSVTTSAQISCTLPQVIDQARVGERIWFDDGRIGGVIQRALPDCLEVAITQAREGGEKLVGDKGINLPDSELDLPSLTEKDIGDLAVVAQYADMVGLSFVQQASDVHLLREHLHQLGRDDIGIVLKIETIQGFENLPELMLAAMAGPSAGVMIARGDLAVECGYERLAEVQEEILWCAESAHMPVIWATQVLETLAKTGIPSRAEISDAGLGVRAECVMLNKGPYITDAIHTLDDILRRMGGHQAKKRPLLRALHAWRGGTHTAICSK
jgi:pyruvate kinase